MSGRVGALAIVLFVALLLQAVVAPMVAIGGWSPEIVLATVIAFALVDGAETGARYGFVAGLGADLLSGGSHLVGVMALVFLLVGEGVGRLRPYLGGTDAAAAFALGALGGVVAFGFFGGLSLLLDIRRFTLAFVVQGAVATGLWTALATPLAAIPIRVVSRRFSQGEVTGAGSATPGRGW